MIIYTEQQLQEVTHAQHFCFGNVLLIVLDTDKFINNNNNNNFIIFIFHPHHLP